MNRTHALWAAIGTCLALGAIFVSIGIGLNMRHDREAADQATAVRTEQFLAAVDGHGLTVTGPMREPLLKVAANTCDWVSQGGSKTAMDLVGVEAGFSRSTASAINTYALTYYCPEATK